MSDSQEVKDKICAIIESLNEEKHNLDSIKSETKMLYIKTAAINSKISVE